MKETIQYPVIVMPTTASLTGNRLGYEVENVNDAVAHYSDPVMVQDLQEKIFHISATEWVTMASPGNINVWVELAPYSYLQMLQGITTPGTWALLGAVAVIVATGVTLTAHSIIMPWATHSFYARVGVQAAGASAPDFWMCQAVIEGKG